jgi:hypothetical protein
MLRHVLKYSYRPIKNVFNAQFSSYYLFNQFNLRSYNFNRCYVTYGSSSLNEHKHVRIFHDINIVDDEEPDSFVDIEKFRQAEAERGTSYNSVDFRRAIASCLKLQRYKLGISIVEFVLINNTVENRDMINIFKLISEAYTHQAISYEKGQEMIKKLMPLIRSLPPFISAQLNEIAMLFSEKNIHGSSENEQSASIIPQEKQFASLLTHAIRRRDIDEMRKLAIRYPSLSAYDTILLEEWFKWVEEVPSQGAELVQLFMNSMTQNYRELSADFIDNFIKRYNKIKHLPPFKQVKINSNGKCSKCLSKFDLKPTFTDKEFNEFSKFALQYAKSKLIPVQELERIDLTCKKLLKWKKDDAFLRPICLADVPNITYGNGQNYLANIRLLKTYIEQMLADFSAVCLISKFPLPPKIANEISQLDKVFYFKTHFSSYDDDTMLLLMYTKCGKDTYCVTNDQFRDHLSMFEELNGSIPELRLQKLIVIRTLRMNKTAGFLEKPSEFSPFIQKTSTGFHVPLRRIFVTSKENYDYYCCHKLF